MDVDDPFADFSLRERAKLALLDLEERLRGLADQRCREVLGEGLPVEARIDHDDKEVTFQIDGLKFRGRVHSYGTDNERTTLEMFKVSSWEVVHSLTEVAVVIQIQDARRGPQPTGEN